MPEPGDAPPRVLLISHFYPPESVGGAEVRVEGYAVELARRGYAIQVLAAGTWERGDQHWNGHRDSIERGVAVRRVDLNWRRAADPNRVLYANPEVARRLAVWLEEWRPDLVHVTSCYTLSAEVLEVVHRRHVPLVLHLTDFWFLCPSVALMRGNGELCDGQTTPRQCVTCLLHGRRALDWPRRLVGGRVADDLLERASHHRWINRLRPLKGGALNVAERKVLLERALSLPDRVVAPSEHLRRVFAAGGSRVPIEVILSGHEVSAPIARAESEELRFGFIGQVQAAKGVHLAVEAFSEASIARPASLTIYGGPVVGNAYRDRLVAGSRERSEIRFPGVIPREKVPEALAHLDVLLVPSLWHENNPRVVQEAFHAGVPVVASDVGGIAEFVRDGVDALTFERGSVAALCRAIERLGNDPTLLPRLRAGLPPVKSQGQEVDELEALYGELLYPATSAAPASSRWKGSR